MLSALYKNNLGDQPTTHPECSTLNNYNTCINLHNYIQCN